MSVPKNNLIAKAIAVPFTSEIFQNLNSSFMLLIGVPLAIQTYSDQMYSGQIYYGYFLILNWIGTALFFPISMTALRSFEDKSYFAVPTSAIILKKFWKVFQVGCVSMPIYLLGLLFFVVPGIIVWKKYIYVFVISEQEMFGPLDSMRKSSLMSQRNGWRLFLMTLILLVITAPFIIISISLSGIYPRILTFFLELAVQWILILSGTAICFYGYKEALAID